MGDIISILQKQVEGLAKDNKWGLRVGGLFITLTLVSISGFCGWLIERLALPASPFPQSLGSILVVVGLTSTIAARSLRDSVLDVIKAIPKSISEGTLQPARQKLSHIVGRDVWLLNKPEILRATAETASENSVDGIFSPLFWMFIGAILWNISPDLPGPLALSLIFKASSTIDSMIGYQHGRMQWLGTAGAKLDDALTWIPCRIVLVTLPLASQPIQKIPILVRLAWLDGSKDRSPNAGISEAIFAHCAQVKMGGRNRYKQTTVNKPILAKAASEASTESIKRILSLSLMLEFTWLAAIAIIALIFTVKGYQ